MLLHDSAIPDSKALTNIYRAKKKSCAYTGKASPLTHRSIQDYAPLQPPVMDLSFEAQN